MMKQRLLTALCAALITAPGHALVIQPEMEFGSGNGNIRCAGSASAYANYVACETDQRAINVQPPTARPEHCRKQDWMRRFSLDGHGEADAYATCEDNRLAGGKTLQEGETEYGKNWQCTGLADGIRCQNADGHGFTLTRQAQMLNVADVVERESVGVFLGEGGEIGFAVSLVHGGAF